MARKMGVYAVLAYVLYGLFYYWYLFYFADTSLPFEYQGSSADPATFLNGRELVLSEEYSKTRNLLFFLATPLEWLIYFLILLLGLSKAFKRWADESAKYKILQTPIYLIWLSVVAYVATFPLSYISYSLAKTYNISTQTFTSFMKDELIDFWVNYGTMLIVVSVLYWLMNKSAKRWWLYAWFLSIPFTLFMMFLQPVVIDPLYNDFYPLKNKELETKILKLASEAKIPAEHVFEVNMAEKTNALNAYVTGIGSNSRIVLWDTTLNRLSDDQILFIMAHEMAHYVEKHLYFGIAGYLLLSLLGLYLTYRLMNWSIRRWGNELKVTEMKDIRSLPLFFMILSILMFVSSPFSNFVSRYQEMRADRYAIHMTENSEAAITSFQELSRSGLSQVNPPLLVKLFRYGHPTMLERISMIEEFQLKNRNEKEE
ncbi:MULTISPECIES: M48 family metallopeptidase [unclassified Bacillus (in: firmicutes)]|uniref:M48 family metallopeptidase n=1 Tax=unclassified Bacillus (in: firmicutes) TaxID=185979 RepID=UPI0008E5BCC3|nr:MULTISPECIES: M48 family metallopeptidase [unclassified Bacillus (in: firmicutes)]SFA79692.1 Zn-dependent protease with chaperone function [Bacillus sp. UNCCL13]SFQ69747.1 Zn-dependent protease with chaperone function [Bacillus sp. cl95]